MRRRAAIRTEEVDQLHLGGTPVTCLLRRSSARRSLAMRVDSQGRVVVNAPLHAPVRTIREFVARHADWLRGQLARLPLGAGLWQAGSALPFLGETLLLGVDSGVPYPYRDGGRLHVPDLEVAGEAVPAWYRTQARVHLDARLKAICRGLGRAEPPWRLSDAQTRWGSLSVKGVVSLNWRLVKASHTEIDYVICHELAHFRQRNHSPAFWREVGALCPGYEEARQTLRRNGPRYLRF